jgi:hypothetical protein
MRTPILTAALIAAMLVPAAAPAAPAPSPPQRKAGWWEMIMQMSAPAPMTQRMNLCTDAATEARNSAFAGQSAPGSECTQGPIARTPTGWRFASTCRAGGMTTTTTGEASGDFDTSYRVEATTRMTPAPMPEMAETKMVITSRWLGPCPAGRVPGDMVMGNGMVMNLNRR